MTKLKEWCWYLWWSARLGLARWLVGPATFMANVTIVGPQVVRAEHRACCFSRVRIVVCSGDAEKVHLHHGSVVAAPPVPIEPKNLN